MTPQEIRERILDAVAKNGGHLASSLGAVEISMALCDVFDPERDRIVWDVGHQAYAWKLLTDRGGKSFVAIRTMDGVAPFPSPLESKADPVVCGHAGISLSVASGMASARDMRKTGESVVAVVGDASIVNGSSFEALNNLAASTEKLIVILNDNEMSISRPTGSVAKLLGRLITSVGYNRVKSAAESAGHRMRLTFLRGAYHRLESRIKSWFVGNACFEQFGLRYIGPVDGHDIAKLKAAFQVAKEDKRSVLVHVVTRKGRGFTPAENDPTKYHGVSSSEKKPGGRSWSDCFGNALCEIARADERVVAITAGMKDGTGLNEFATEFPKRFYDVGIAEGHMVAFAAGLAASGMRPVVAVYSTFLQRAIDQVMHDVCIANLPVVLCVDRAGVVGSDGVTHQGVFDIAMLRCLPNLAICQPKDAADMKSMLAEALIRNGPTLIRYPRGNAPELQLVPPPAPDARLAIWATGDQLSKASEVASLLGGAEVVFARCLKPYDAELLAKQRASGMRIASIENGAVCGGFGEAIGADFRFGWPDEFIPHGKVNELERRYGFDSKSIADAIKAQMGAV